MFILLFFLIAKWRRCRYSFIVRVPQRRDCERFRSSS